MGINEVYIFFREALFVLFATGPTSFCSAATVRLFSWAAAADPALMEIIDSGSSILSGGEKTGSKKSGQKSGAVAEGRGRRS
jgi:hypothetical protein